LPEAYIAPRELRDLRDVLRHRVALTRMRSALKNRVSAILAKHGIQRPYSDLSGLPAHDSAPRSSCAPTRAGGSTACCR
jgi:transposase